MPEDSKRTIELMERLIIGVERIAKSLETIAPGIAKITAGMPASAAIAKSKQSSGKKPSGDDLKIVRGIVTQLTKRGDWTNAEIEQSNGRHVWVASKLAEKVQPLEDAYQSGREVEIGYKEKVNGEYTNRYIEEIVLGAMPKVHATAPSDDDDMPV